MENVYKRKSESGFSQDFRDEINPTSHSTSYVIADNRMNVIAGLTRNLVIFALAFLLCGVGNIYAQCTPITAVTVSSPDAKATTIVRNMDYYGVWKNPNGITFTASATGGSAATAYEWYVDGMLQLGETTATFVFSPPAGVEAAYSVYAAAVNACTKSNTARSKEMIVFATKNQTMPPPPPEPEIIYPEAPEGNFCLSGQICFDVMKSEGGESCGDLSGPWRTSDFSEPTRTYTLSGDASEIAFYIMDDDEKVVRSLTTTGNTVVVTFRPDVNTVMTGKKGKFTLVVQFKDNSSGNYLQRSLIIKVQDCMCGCIVKKSTCSWTAFMCYNMGADPTKSIQEQMTYNSQASGAASTDTTVYGWLYQWGRRADGHQRRSSTAVSGGSGTITYTGGYDANQQITTEATDYYGHHIYFSGSIRDWHGNGVDMNDDLWNHTTTLGKNNNPCPSGWRVPTSAEWQAVVNNNTLVNSFTTTTGTRGITVHPNGAGNPAALFLSAAGTRASSNRYIDYAGTEGLYWSSNTYGNNVYDWYFGSGSVNPNVAVRAIGLSLRCVEE